MKLRLLLAIAAMIAAVVGEGGWLCDLTGMIDGNKV